jgi:hypothetical protein
MDITVSPEQFLDMEPNKRLMVVKEHIELNPEHHDQACFADWDSGFLKISNPTVRQLVKASEYGCRTALCVCGWTNLLAGNPHFADLHEAAGLLGLSDDESDDLFLNSETNDEALELMNELIKNHS